MDDEIGAAYSVQRGHDAVSFCEPGNSCSFILAPHDGHARSAGVRRLSFSTTTGFVRPWLKLTRGSKTSFAIPPPPAEPDWRASERARDNAMFRLDFPGGSDGARTRDLRRDRPTL